ncbi:hypothetical protein AAHA92_10986 [Salvia divinorum]|uniref:Uncharacterized protein n=1 Tax=Salvia divinorum TaxID=28513 RepID=A0ABD1HZV0_SALDI
MYSIVSSLHDKNIPMPDVEEMELQVGLKESILKASLTSSSALTDALLNSSLTSTSALTDALLNSMPIKLPKREI